MEATYKDLIMKTAPKSTCQCPIVIPSKSSLYQKQNLKNIFNLKILKNICQISLLRHLGVKVSSTPEKP
jgi:hypothetical protein